MEIGNSGGRGDQEVVKIQLRGEMQARKFFFEQGVNFCKIRRAKVTEKTANTSSYHILQENETDI